MGSSGAASGKSSYLFVAFCIGMITLIAAASYAVPNAQVLTSTGSTSNTNHVVPILDLNYLTPSQAREYGIHDLLNVSSGALSITASPGQRIQIPLMVTLEAFDSQVASATVSLKPAPGQLAVGSLDLSGHESFSSSTLQLAANQTTTVVMTFTMPNYSTEISFQLSPSGITVVPSVGIAVLIDTNISVNYSP